MGITSWSYSCRDIYDGNLSISRVIWLYRPLLMVMVWLLEVYLVVDIHLSAARVLLISAD